MPSKLLGIPNSGQLLAPIRAGGGSAGSSRFFARQVLGADATVITISGLDGDTDRVYKIHGYGPITGAGSKVAAVGMNGIAASGAILAEYAFGSVTVSNPAGARIIALAGESTAARVTGAHFQLIVNAVRGTGFRQTVHAISYGVWSGSAQHQMFEGSQDTNLTGNLTVLTITASAANAFGTGFTVDIMGDDNAF